MFRRNTGLPKPSTTDITVGLDVVSGSAFSRRWRQLVPSLKSFPSTALISRRIVPPKAQRGAWTQAVGTSRGGRTSKIHCLADDRGRPVAFSLTPGNIADIRMAIPLLEAICPTRRLLADKAYDADSLRGWLTGHKIKALIPSSAARRTPYPLDRPAKAALVGWFRPALRITATPDPHRTIFRSSL